jgi:hypothetical protein
VEEVKTAFACILLILEAQFLHAQTRKPWTVDGLCGQVESVRRTPEKHNLNSFSQKRKSLRDVSLSLYERRSTDEVCCDGAKAIETVTSGKGGHFHFNTRRLGNYWIGTNWNGKNSKIAVDYEPQKGSQSLCSEQGIQLDDQGNAEWWAL